MGDLLIRALLESLPQYRLTNGEANMLLLIEVTNSREEDEQIGGAYRRKTHHRKKMSFIDAELSDAVNPLRKAASRLECLLAK